MTIDRQAVKRDFSRAAATYDAHAGVQRDVLRDLLNLYQDALDSKARVLDGGCGTGALAKELQNRKMPWRLIQLDIAEGMTQRAKKNPYPTICADISSVPLIERSFNGIFSSLCLQWVDDAAAALSDMRRVLTDDGVIMLSTLGPNTLSELRTAWQRLGADAPVHRFLPLKALWEAFHAAGLRVQHHHTARHIRSFPQLRGLFLELGGLGATYKPGAQARSRLPLAELALAYPKSEESSEFPATFEVFHFLLSKQAP